jgi:REP element-mobilizing transposase RayT
MPFPPGPGSKSLRIGRHSQSNGIYFITLTTDQRLPWFTEFDLACNVARALHEKPLILNSETLCWVVMPDHVHILLQLREASLHDAIHRFKGRSALRLNSAIGRKGRFWQPGFYDHALRKEDDMLGIARYIIANPIRAGLSRKYGSYPFWDAKWV